MLFSARVCPSEMYEGESFYKSHRSPRRKAGGPSILQGSGPGWLVWSAICEPCLTGLLHWTKATNQMKRFSFQTMRV